MENKIDEDYEQDAIYNYDLGGEENEEEAIKSYRKAAEQGHAEAQFRLGSIYSLGWSGVEENSEEAAEWYEKAAEQNHGGAQLFLAMKYYDGKGVEQNLMKAYALASLAKANGTYGVEELLENIEKEIEEVKEMAKQCIESGYKDCGEE